MNKNVVIVVIILALLLGGVALYANNQAQQEKMKQDQMIMQQKKQAEDQQKMAMQKAEEEKMKADQEKQAKMHEITLAAIASSTESGTVTLLEQDGKVQVSVKMKGGDPAAIQPMHIHMGACPGIGKVLYPLTDVVNGESQTTLPVSMADLAKQLPLAINVHKSKKEISTYMACGDISASNLVNDQTLLSPHAASGSSVVSPVVPSKETYK